MDPQHMVLFAAALPLGAAAILTFALSRTPRTAPFAAAPSIALAFCAAWVALAGLPATPPASKWHWLFFGALAAGVAGLFEPRAGAGLRWAVRVALAGAAAWLVSGAPSALWVAVPLVFTLLQSAAFDSLAPEDDGRPFVAGAVVASVAAAAAIGLSGWAQLATIGGALAASVGGAGVVGLFRPVSFRGAVFPASLLLAGLLTAATRWSELPPAAALLVGAAPVAASLASRIRWTAATPLRRILVAAAVAAVVGGAGVAVAVSMSPPLEY